MHRGPLARLALPPRRVVSRKDGPRTRVIIYDPSGVQKALSRVPSSAFDRMGYPRAVGPKEFLEEVGRRWRGSREILYEIGLALGYPVKDVLGFIGFTSLQCTGLCGWRIYGDSGQSLLMSRTYKNAKETAKAFLDNGQDRRRLPVSVKSPRGIRSVLEGGEQR